MLIVGYNIQFLYFNGKIHITLHLSNCLVEKNLIIQCTPKELRDGHESFWMHKLKTLVPFGINAADGSNQTRTRPNMARPRALATSTHSSQASST